jgi:plastocyanin
VVGGAGGLLLAATTVNALADDDDEDTTDTPDDDNSGPGSGGDGHGDYHSGHGRGGDDDEVVITGEVPAGSIEIVIDDDDADAFNPGSLTVDLGQSVTFINADDDPHTATGSGFDTGAIQPGGTATVVLDTPGAFAYSCQFHPVMTGSIGVRDENGQVPPPAQSAAPAGAASVQIVNLSFDPSTLTVPAGTTVSWSNEDAVPHTVTAEDGSFDSGIFDPGSTFSWEFTTPGTFAYVCNLHPQMQGSVDVTGEAVAVAEASPVAATPAAGGMSGSWTVEFATEPDAGISPLRGLVTFHDDGTLVATLAVAGEGENGLGFDYGPARGTWTGDSSGTIRAVMVAFLLDAEQRYAGTLTIHDEIDLDDAAETYQGAFSFTAEGVEGEELAAGDGTSQGERMQPDEALVISLATPVARPVVTIVDFDFEPLEIEVPAGGTVTWVNDGQAPHTATADDGSFDTGVIVPGADGSQIFDQPGTYPYFCAIHPDMQGTVVVR